MLKYVNTVNKLFMNKVRKTQVDSFTSVKQKLGAKQRAVAHALKILGEASNKDLSRALGWAINSVTGRVTELVDRGIVTSNSTKVDPDTNRTVTVWRLA